MKNRTDFYLIIILLLFPMLLYSCNGWERKQIKKASVLIEKIEMFKTNHNRLPDSFKEMGIEETGLLGGCCGEGADILYYMKTDSLHYIVYFGTTLGEGLYYYSDTKQWEHKLRGGDY